MTGPGEEWSGEDRRRALERYELLELIDEQFTKREEAMAQEIAMIKRRLYTSEAKVAQWETGAAVVRWLVIGIAGFIPVAIAVGEWWKGHVK